MLSEKLDDYLGVFITKKTLCTVGCHMWVWTSGFGSKPPRFLRCDCGMYTYQNYHDDKDKYDD